MTCDCQLLFAPRCYVCYITCCVIAVVTLSDSYDNSGKIFNAMKTG